MSISTVQINAYITGLQPAGSYISLVPRPPHPAFVTCSRSVLQAPKVGNGELGTRLQLPGMLYA